ncbi:Phosphoglycerate dehydrogenase [Paenibacillus sp. 1_12]|uniref:hydroxyacid dehydrogenase n=1 Tax=Paenibacillus sp. 1_12 TaxID=1566278 RepID=UPI0008EA57A2|nr:hydroxyacid dehydrogenase [Paenibacillus sp. 1_12]SFL34464.1 Phosphoglycerate dehydrogenase [Paenibacillus sp. 1_12]
MRTLVTVWKKELRQLLFTEEVIKQLESVSEVDWVPEGTMYEAAQFEQDIHRYDACLTSWGSPKITVEVLSQAKQLRFVGHAAGTLTPYVEPSIFQRPIKVVNANTALAKSTAELAVTLMMSGSWEILNYRDRLKSGLWGDSGNGSTVSGLSGQTVGIIGLGEISREVIRILHAFHTRVLLYSPYCSVEEAEVLGVTLCSLEDVLRNCRIVSLHDTLTTSTRGMIGKEQLKLMVDGALLINTARGPLIDETALLDELTSGRISAALDVYHNEPVQEDYPLLKLPNVICLPHIGAYSGYWKSQLGAMVVEDLVRFVTGQPCLREVNEERFLRMTKQ